MNPLQIVIIVAVIVLVILILKYMLTNPYTLQNIQNAQTASVISASSLATNGSSVPSSNFAYSIWMYINDWNYRYGEPKVVFGRMGSSSDSSGNTSITGVSGVDPCPAVVLGAIENNIAVSLGCYPGIDQVPTTSGGSTVVHTCAISNIPIQKWVNLIVSVYGRTMDLYIDGKLVKTCLLPGIAHVNNNADVYVTPSGGYNGWTSKFQYYPTPINPQDAWNIYTSGYSSSWFNLSQSYQVQLSLIENGTTQSSVTI
jgi:hypothetical protein